MEGVDPYYIWLGIAPEEQPPNHYRLLGLRAFEDNAEVIREAALRQMAHVRTYQLGPHQETSQQVLNELAAARSCLLDPQRKLAYDLALRTTLASRTPPEPPPSPPPVPPGARRPRNWAAPTAALACLAIAVAGVAILARMLGEPQGHVEEARRVDASAPSPSNPPPRPAEVESGDPEGLKPQAESAKPTPPSRDEPGQKDPGPEQQPSEMKPGPPSPAAPAEEVEERSPPPEPAPSEPIPPAPPASYGRVVLQWPEQERADAALFLDGQRLPVPLSGPLEFQRPVGACLLEATRPAHERFATKIAVAPDRTVSVEVAWKPVARNTVNLSGVWQSTSGTRYRFRDDEKVIQVKVAGPSREYFSGRLIRQGSDELRSTLWEATFANDPLRRRWKLRAEFTVVSGSELRCRFEKVIWGNSPSQVERVFPNHSTWNKVE